MWIYVKSRTWFYRIFCKKRYQYNKRIIAYVDKELRYQIPLIEKDIQRG